MKGIPVLPNGDPVTMTLVVAGSYQQFSNWCMCSKVNPRSKHIKYVDRAIRGYRDVDMVFTGTWADSRWLDHDSIIYLRNTGAIATEYWQYESADIEANIVDDLSLSLSGSYRG